LSFSQGRMIIVADNSEIQFEIDNEDVSQANVTLTTSAGAESSAQSMSTWSSALSIKLPKNKFLIHDGGTGSSTPAITLDNYSQLVALAFDVYNGHAVVRPISHRISMDTVLRHWVSTTISMLVMMEQHVMKVILAAVLITLLT